VIAKVSIDDQGNFFVAKGSEAPVAVAPELLESYITDLVAQDTTTYIALHADQNIAYKEVVRVLDIANQHKLKLVIATTTPDK
jgi:biopolymer transport protein ExbD